MAVPTANTWIQVEGLKAAGLNDGSDQAILYVRDLYVILWDRLQKLFEPNHEYKGLIVEGPPGVGKSLEVWHWASYVSSHLKKKLLWCHIHSSKNVYMIEKSETCVTRICTLEEASKALETSNCDICILDGYQEKYGLIYESLFSFRTFPSRKAVMVSSLAKNFHLESGDLCEVESTFMGGWSLPELKAACRNASFYSIVSPFLEVSCVGPISGSPGSAQEGADAQGTLGKRPHPSMTSDDIDRIIEHKYFYAGASARWMFATRFERLKEIIQWNLDRVPNFETFFQGLCGLRSAHTNHLVTMFTDASLSSQSKNRNFVSKYVGARLFQTCKTRAFSLAYSLAADNKNPAFRGWIHEFDLVDQIQALKLISSPLQLINPTTSRVETLDIAGFEEFDPQFTDGVQGQLKACYWLRPMRWNQAGYDLVRTSKVNDSKFILQIMQVTGGKTHELNLNHFAELAVNVAKTLGEETTVEIYVLVPHSVAQPELKIENDGALAAFKVGSGEEKWEFTQVRRHILFRRFKTREEGPLTSIA